MFSFSVYTEGDKINENQNAFGLELHSPTRNMAVC